MERLVLINLVFLLGSSLVTSQLAPSQKIRSRLLNTYTTGSGEAWTLALHPNGNLISGSTDGMIRFWNLTSQECTKTIETGTVVESLITLSTGDFASSHYDHTIRIWNKNDLDRKCVLQGHSDIVYRLVSLNEIFLASSSRDKTIKIWNQRDCSLVRNITGHTGDVYGLLLLKDGDLASASYDGTVRIWNWKDGTLKRTLVSGNPSTGLVQLPNGDLASSSTKGVNIWYVGTGTLKWTLNDHSKPVWNLRLLSNGYLVTPSDDSLVTFWDTYQGITVDKLYGHSAGVIDVLELSSCRLATASRDKTIKIWSIC